ESPVRVAGGEAAVARDLVQLIEVEQLEHDVVEVEAVLAGVALDLAPGLVDLGRKVHGRVASSTQRTQRCAESAEDEEETEAMNAGSGKRRCARARVIARDPSIVFRNPFRSSAISATSAISALKKDTALRGPCRGTS